MKKILLLISLIIPIMANAQNTASLWKKVNKANDEGKPQTAAQYLAQLEEAAAKQGDELEQLYISQLLYDTYREYNWKEANAYYPKMSSLRQKVYASIDEYIDNNKGHKRLIMLLYKRVEDRKSDIDRNPNRTGAQYRDIRRQCMEIIASHPGEKYYTAQLKQMVESMDSRSLSSSDKGQMAPASQVKFKLYSRNIPEVDVEVYRMKDNRLFEGYVEKKVRQALKSNATLVTSFKYADFANDYNISEEHDIFIDLEQVGNYVIMISNGDDCYCANACVSNVAAAVRDIGGHFEIYAADITTGKPYDAVDADIYRNENDAVNGIRTLKSTATERVPLDGFTLIGERRPFTDNKHGYALRLSKEGDLSSPLISLYRTYYGQMDRGFSVPSECIYTDRKLYKPTDTIYFKVLHYTSDGLKGHPVPNSSVEVSLYAPKSRETLSKLTLVTNDMGSASGFFTIPEGSQNGTYVISSGLSSASVRVETYKRPTFQIELQKNTDVNCFGDVVIQKGMLKSYAGFNIAGADVEYTVERQTGNTWGRYCGFWESATIAEGKVTSGNDGSFEVSFTAEKPEIPAHATNKDKVAAAYVINIKATDPQGETHSASVSVPVSDVPIDLNVEIKGSRTHEGRVIVDKDEIDSFLFKVTTLNGTPYGTEGSYTIEGMSGNVVRKGEFTSNEEMAAGFRSLPSGPYVIKAETRHRGVVIDTKSDIVLISKEDRKLPYQSDFFHYVICDRDTIDFLIGTSNELYLEMEIFDGNKVLYRKPLHLQEEMSHITLPYDEKWPTSVSLNLFGFRNGREVSKKCTFTNPQSIGIDVSIETLRDRTAPGNKEQMVLKAPSGSELLVSIFDVTTDRYGANSFWFSPISTASYKTMPYVTTSIGGGGGGIRIRGTRALAKGGNAVFNSAAMVESSAAPMQEMVYNDEAADMIQEEEAQEEPEQEFTARDNMSELIGFFPHVRPDADGRAVVEYTVGGALSTFRVLVMGYDSDLKTGNAEASFVVQKELMVMPNLPLFVRANDEIVLKAKVVNLSDRVIDGTAHISVTDPATGKEIKFKAFKNSRKLKLIAGAQDEISWTVKVPEGISGMKVKITYGDATASDGEIGEIIVESDETTLTEAASFIIGSGHGFSYYEKMLKEKFNAPDAIIRRAEFSTLDAVKESLPKASKPASDNIIDWVSQFYINQMRQKVLAADNKLSQGDKDQAEAFRKEAVARISKFQDSDGGMSWFRGMGSSTTLTLYFLDKIGQLRETGAITLTSQEQAVVERAVRFVDAQIARSYDRDIEYGFANANMFDIRTRWMDIEMSNNASKAFSRYLEKTADGWQKISILQKAQLIRTLMRCEGTKYWDKSTFGKRIEMLGSSLADYAVQNRTVGCYFPNAVMPFRGMMNNEIYAHSLLIDVFSRLGEKKVVNGIAQWLLLQKHNQAWSNTVATTDAVHALVSSNAKDLRLGAVYYTYKTRLVDAKESANEITIRREFIRASTGAALKDGEELKVGDEIIVRYLIHNSENRSFVRMEAMRPASFYPKDERSYYSWWGFYREMRESVTNYYWELLPEENTTVEERFFVTQEGTFNSGLVTIECLYADEYRGHTGASMMTSAMGR